MASRFPLDRRVAILGLILATLVHGIMLHDAGNDPFVFAALGEDDTVATAHVMEVLDDPTLPTRPSQGHDGKYFLLQSWDPFYLTGDHAEFLDRPVYRAQRMLFPAIIGLGGLAPKASVPTLMILTGILSMAWGTLATARLAQRYGKSPLLGLAFTLNPGVLAELGIGGASVLAFALAAWATLAAEEGRIGRASGLFLLSALTREVMLFYVAGVGLLWILRHRRLPLLLTLPSAVGVAGWNVYLRLRLGADSGVDGTLGWPFEGVVDALPIWRSHSAGSLILIGVVGIGLLLNVVLLVRDRTALLWGSAGLAGLAPFLSVWVWTEGFDISRAILPTFTAVIVAVAPAVHPGSGEPPDDEHDRSVERTGELRTERTARHRRRARVTA